MNRHVRTYRRLLQLYPAGFREEYSDEMTRLFADQLRDARAVGGSFAAARLWARSAVDVMTTAPAHHIRREEPVPRPIDGPVAALEAPTPPYSALPRLALGLLPLWVMLFLVVTAPGFMDPLFLIPPAILGLPAGVVLLATAMLWTGLGLLVLRTWRSTLGAIIALVGFVGPATFLIVYGPAMVLMVQNMP